MKEYSYSICLLPHILKQINKQTHLLYVFWSGNKESFRFQDVTWPRWRLGNTPHISHVGANKCILFNTAESSETIWRHDIIRLTGWQKKSGLPQSKEQDEDIFWRVDPDPGWHGDALIVFARHRGKIILFNFRTFRNFCRSNNRILVYLVLWLGMKVDAVFFSSSRPELYRLLIFII